jgi:SAM-dependent methyltransferase
MLKRSSFSDFNGLGDGENWLVSELRLLLERRIISSRASEMVIGSLLATFAEKNLTIDDPVLLGSVFESRMNPAERHLRGAHYTPISAIYDYVVRPTLIEPWHARIHQANTKSELLHLHEALANLRILDPACGSGNFLYVAYQGLLQLEHEMIMKARNDLGTKVTSRISTQQLRGLDNDPLAVELAKITLYLAQKSTRRSGDSGAKDEKSVLDVDIRHADALFCPWPKADLILGNPPFQSKNQMQREFGPDYVQRLRKAYPDVPGRADYCVYWFRRAHDELSENGRAGLVGTNTIRQNYSREGGLDHIVKNGGTIVHAISTMVWPGEAIVHVSVVNWIKGQSKGPKKLAWQRGDHFNDPWQEILLDHIPASLSADVDVTNAKILGANIRARTCFQGQTHGHEGFLLSATEAASLLKTHPNHKDVVFPYLVGDDLLSKLHGKPSRWIIDFSARSEKNAAHYEQAFQRVKERVLPDRKAAAIQEEKRNQGLSGRANQHHAHFLKRWWLLSYARGELMQKIQTLPRYIACSRVTKRPIFEFISPRIHPSDAITVFPLADDYSFGILQSSLHWAWFTARCSTLTARFRYTSETVFDSFPWPQLPTEKQCAAVAKAAISLRTLRRQIADEHGLNLRSMYASMENPGTHPLKDAHAALDETVRIAYGMPARKDPLTYLLELNRDCADKEIKGLEISGPGLPRELELDAFVTADCVEPDSF